MVDQVVDGIYFQWLVLFLCYEVRHGSCGRQELQYSFLLIFLVTLNGNGINERIEENEASQNTISDNSSLFAHVVQ